MDLEKFREHLSDCGIKIEEEYPVESSHCFVCEDILLFYYEDEQNIAMSFQKDITPRKAAFYVFCFMEIFPKLDSIAIMDSHIKIKNQFLFIEEEKIKMGENREKIADYTNILLNEKGYSC
jgi:hypothetical protein